MSDKEPPASPSAKRARRAPQTIDLKAQPAPDAPEMQTSEMQVQDTSHTSPSDPPEQAPPRADEAAAGSESPSAESAASEAPSPEAAPSETPAQNPTPAREAAILGGVLGAVAGALVSAGIVWFGGLAPADDAGPRIAALQGALDHETALAARKADLDALSRQVTGLAGDIKSNTARLAAADRKLDALKGSGGAGVDAEQMKALAGEVDALNRRIAALDPAQAAQAVAEARKAGARMSLVTRVLLANELVRAVDEGVPYSPLMDALQNAGTDAALIAPLKAGAASGVTTAQALARDFAALAPRLAAAPAPQGDWLQRLKAGALRLVRITPVGAPAGHDPVSLVARIGDDLDRGDTIAALAAWQALPEMVRGKAQGFGQRLEARAAALQAAHRVSDAAMAALTASVASVRTGGKP